MARECAGTVVSSSRVGYVDDCAIQDCAAGDCAAVDAPGVDAPVCFEALGREIVMGGKIEKVAVEAQDRAQTAARTT